MDEILNHPRDLGYRYFVRGGLKPALQRRRPTDFGDGIYAWEDDEEGLRSAIEWATGQWDPVVASAVPVVQLLRISTSVFAQAIRCNLREHAEERGSKWDIAVQWYRQHNAAQENGPLADYDIVAGPQAVQRKRRWCPELELQDQYRFLPRSKRHVELVLELELV